MTKKLVIFDCDGVLVDSEYIASQVFSTAMKEYGYSISAQECMQRFTGMSAQACRHTIMQESGLHIPEDYWNQLQPLLSTAYQTKLTALMEPLLKELQKFNIPRCVASNSSRKHVLNCLELTKQLNYFFDSAIFSAQQVAFAKPAPDLFLYAAKTLNVDPKDCLVIEDSLIGAQAAKAAGMQVFMFFGGTHAKHDWYHQQFTPHDHKFFLNCEDLKNAIHQNFNI